MATRNPGGIASMASPRDRVQHLLPTVVDMTAKEQPEALWAQIPVSSSTYEQGFRQVTYKHLANAINGVAWLLYQELGQGKNHETLLYIGPNDMRYVVITLGAVKAGYKVLVVSPRFPVADYVGLCTATDCTRLMTPDVALGWPLVKDLLSRLPLSVLRCPDLSHLLDAQHAHYAFTKTFSDSKDQPLVVFTTSGTTGTAKPVIFSHDFAASLVKVKLLEPPAGFLRWNSAPQGTRMFLTLAFFHPGNLCVSMIGAIVKQLIIISPLAGVPPSLQFVTDALDRIGVDLLVLMPPIVSQLAANPSLLEHVTTKVKTIVYGGADFADEDAGAAVASRCQLINSYGATEMGGLPQIKAVDDDPVQDWRYIRPHPSSGFEFRLSDATEQLFHLVIVRKPGQEEVQPVFKLLPRFEEFPTGDLFRPHPTRSGLWRFEGRAGDTIMFKFGNLCNPARMENLVSSLPFVCAALMAGTGRSQPLLLIELVDPEHAVITSAWDEIWAAVDQANQEYQLGARVAKTHILLTDPAKPILRTAKGSLQKKATLAAYAEEIDKLYSRAGDSMSEVMSSMVGTRSSNEGESSRNADQIMSVGEKS